MRKKRSKRGKGFVKELVYESAEAVERQQRKVDGAASER